MITIDIITLFPNLFTEHLNNLPFKKAVSKGLIKVNLINLRDYALDSYGSVDDKTYGGGTGMILMIEPVYNALTDIYGQDFENKKDAQRKIVALTPRGKRFTQEDARKLSQQNRITFICGRYEGMDARIEDNLATDKVSIGDFILSGGEIPCLAVLEGLTRLLPGVLEKDDAAKIESFSGDMTVTAVLNTEYPQYTRPDNFKGLEVPKVLLSGNHKEIEKWRKDNQKPVKK